MQLRNALFNVHSSLARAEIHLERESFISAVSLAHYASSTAPDYIIRAEYPSCLNYQLFGFHKLLSPSGKYLPFICRQNQGCC